MLPWIRVWKRHAWRNHTITHTRRLLITHRSHNIIVSILNYNHSVHVLTCPSAPARALLLSYSLYRWYHFLKLSRRSLSAFAAAAKSSSETIVVSNKTFWKTWKAINVYPLQVKEQKVSTIYLLYSLWWRISSTLWVSLICQSKYHNTSCLH